MKYVQGQRYGGYGMYDMNSVQEDEVGMNYVSLATSFLALGDLYHWQLHDGHHMYLRHGNLCNVNDDEQVNYEQFRDGRHVMLEGYGSYGILVTFSDYYQLMYYSYVLRGGVFCNLNVARWMEFVVFSDDVDIDNDIQNDDMVHVKCVLALSCQANVNTQKPSLKVRQYT
eukprot:TRINITY_DN37_c0_g2_i9.p1 TRINITY_DN37_c0_g2~~TRINITY_DN37_c0_g2_i9.p1  ORF type:complete len:178 (-),score=15.44 TRINITY_DN37_c0_g2_i9:23-532(-)